MKRRLFAQGEFVLDDKNGKAIHVGDTVMISRPSFSFSTFSMFNDDRIDTIDADELIGQVRIYLSKGIVVVDSSGNRRHPSVTKNTAGPPWEWELVEKLY
jgi:hypothetical protein